LNAIFQVKKAAAPSSSATSNSPQAFKRISAAVNQTVLHQDSEMAQLRSDLSRLTQQFQEANAAVSYVCSVSAKFRSRRCNL